MTGKADLAVIRKNLARLKVILTEETTHLKEFKPARLGELYEEKLAVIQELENQKKLLRKFGGMADKSSVEAIELRSLCSEMDSVIEKHGIELIKAREVNKYMMEAIAQAFREHFKEIGVYNSNGIEGQYIPKGESTVPPMKVNQTY